MLHFSSVISSGKFHVTIFIDTTVISVDVSGNFMQLNILLLSLIPNILSYLFGKVSMDIELCSQVK
jgi:hypothetical protein